MNLEKMYEGFKADFPDEAYTVDSSRGFDLTSLKAQFIIERLNEVAGVNGWILTGDFKETEKGTLYLGSLQLIDRLENKSIHSVEAIGFSASKKNVGDTYKGARTDALSKAASYLGVGNDMFKGKIAPKKKGAAPKPKAKTVTLPIKEQSKTTKPSNVNSSWS